MRSNMRNFFLGSMCLYTAFIQAPLFSASASWMGSDGDWGTATKWTPTTVPNGIDEVATFQSNPGTARSITLTTVAPTVGTLSYTSTLNYTISTPGANVLTLQVSSGSATISASAGGVNVISAPITLTSSVSHTQGATGSFTFSGALSSTGGYTKLGTGTVQFSGTSANTYAGLTTVSAGTLQLNKTAGVDAIAAGGVTINGGTLEHLASNQINNSAAVTLSSGGTWNLGTFNETIGSFTFSGGTLTQSSGTLTLSGTGTSLTMGNNATIPGRLVFSAAGNVTYNGTTATATISGDVDIGTNLGHTFTIGNGSANPDMVISGAISSGGSGGQIDKNGTGTLQFAGTTPNTYPNATNINAGTLQLNKTPGVNAIAGGNATINGGTLQHLASNQMNGHSLTCSAGTWNLGTFDESLTTFTFNNGTLTQSTGVLTLTAGASTALTMRASVTIPGPLVFSSSGNINAADATGSPTINGTVDFGISIHTITVTSSPVTLTIANVISGSGTITKAGAGVLRLTAANTHSGNTTINAGTLSLTGSGIVSTTGTVSLTAASSVFDISGITPAGITIGALTFTNGTLTQGGKSLTLSSSGTALTLGNGRSVAGPIAFSAAGSVLYNGTTTVATISNTVDLGSFAHTFNIGSALTPALTISGVMSNGSITKTGTGTLQLQAANTYSGGTTINAGALALSTSGTLSSTGAVTLGGGTFDISAITPASTTIGSLVFNSGTLTQVGKTLTLSGAGAGVLTMGDSTTISGPIAFSAAGDVLYNGSTTVATISSTVDLGGFGHTFDIGSSLTPAMNISGVMSNGSITKTGIGILQLQAANTYSGGTTINAGTLSLSTSGTLASAGAVTLGGGTFDISAITPASTTIGSLVFNSGTLTQSGKTLTLSGAGAGVLTMGDNTTISGPIAFSAAGDVLYNGTTTVATISNTVDLGSFGHTFDIGSSLTPAMIVSGVMSNGSITKTGIGTLELQAANTYSGGTTINAGTLKLTGSGSLASAGSVSVNSSSSVFDISGITSSTTIGDLSGVTSSSVALGAKTLTFGTATASTTFAGVISGTNGIAVKTGSGTAVFTGTNTYTGGTIINSGTLSLSTSGTLASTGDVNISAGTFDISGITPSSTTIGSLTFSIGTLTQGGKTLILSGTGAGILTMGDSTTISGPITFSAAGDVLYNGAMNVATISGAVDLGSFSHIFNINQGLDTPDMTVSGILSGSGGAITKTGTGTLQLQAANTYSGGTTINAGTLSLSGSGSLASTGAVSVNSATSVFDISGVTSSTTIGDLSGVATSSVTLGTKTLTFGTATTSTTFAGSISDSGAVIKAGSGTAVFTGTNTYTGGTTINAGTLSLSGSGSLASTGSVSVNNSSSVFDISGITSSTTIGDLSGVASSSVTLGAKTLTFGTATASTTFAGVISGTNGIAVKTGSGTAVFTGTNTYTGGTTINDGTLSLSGSGTLDATGSVNVNSGTSVFNITAITPTGTTIGDLSGALSSSVLLGAKNLTFGTATTTTTFAGVIDGTGGSISKQGSGAALFTAIQTYTGETNVFAGTLSLSGSGSIANSSGVNVNGGTFDISLTTTGATIQDLSGVGGGFVTLGSKILTFGTASSLSFDGVISGSSGGVVKEGTGTETFTNANTYTGGTTINDGTIALSGSGSLATTGAVSVNGASAVFDINLISASGAIIGDLSGVTGSSVVLGSKNLTFGTTTPSTTFDGVLSGVDGSVTKQGSGATIFTATNSYTGSTTVNSGTLSLSGSGSIANSSGVNVSGGSFDISATTTGATIKDLSGTSSGSITLGSKILTFGTSASPTFDGVISGSGGSIVKNGSGTETLTGTNTYTGGTTINAGEISLSGSGTLASTGTVTVGASGTLDIASASGARTIGPLAGAGAVTMGSNQLTVNSTGSTTYAGNLSGTAGFVKSGGATLTLSGTNGFTGNVTISDGTLALSGTGSIPSSNSIDIASGAFFDLSALTLDSLLPTLTTVTVGNISGAGTVDLGSNNLITTTTDDSLFTGTIIGSGDLEKAGPATWSLTADNSSYTGTVTISQGDLNLNGALGGPVIVGAGGTLSGNGSTGSLTCSGIITTGNNNNIDILTVNGNLTILPGSQTIFDIDPAGNSDLILVSGSGAVSGEIFIDFAPGIYIEGTTYTAVNAAGGVSGVFFPIVDNNADFDVSLVYSSNFIEMVLRNTQLFLDMTFTDPNALAVANALEVMNASGELTTDPDFTQVIASLVGEPTSIVQNALIQMQPSQMSAFSELTAQHGLNLISLLQDRYEMCCKPGCLNCNDNNNFWIIPYGEGLDQHSMNRQYSFDASTFGVAVGGQGSIHHTTLGLAMAYDHSNLKWDHDHGHGDVNNFYAGGYAFQKEKYYYVGLAALYGHNSFNADRHIEFTTINRHAKSNFAGNELIAQFALGFCFPTFIDFSPYADATYVASWRNKYREHGADSLNLRVDSNFSETMFYDAGLDLKKTYRFGTICFTPDVQIGYVREQPIHRQDYKSRFINHSESFKTRGYHKAQNFFNPGLRLTLDIKNTWSISGNYNIKTGSHFFGQNGTLDVKYTF